MLVPSTLRNRLPGIFIPGKLRLHSVRDSTVYSSPDSPVYSPLGSCFGHRGVILPILRSIQQSLKVLSLKKLTVSYFNYLGTCDKCLQKLPNLRDHNRLPGVFISEESVMNMTNSTNIQKNSKTFLGMTIGTRICCLMKKNRRRNTS
jgi:hypothetical protein